MASTNIPSKETLARMVRVALARGVPAEEAEDVVHAAWVKASASFDSKRGHFIALFRTIVERDAVSWWRRSRRVVVGLPNEPRSAQPPVHDPSTTHQARLLQALDADERDVFAVWALQKHLPRGTMDATRAARSLGMSVSDYDNAKKRLARKIRRVLTTLALEPADLFSPIASEEVLYAG
ncbi:MAG: hypothetical protein GY946_16795 [bacterium]|nr:hypothetical protein [bacterium]